MFINTQLFQAGLVTVLINKFKFAIAALLLYLTLSITLHVWSLVSGLGEIMSRLLFVQ